MIIDFFIRRPIFTSVCSFVIILVGLISIPLLPIAQFPDLAPPMITVTAQYVGANPEIVESALTTPLEEAINGAEQMKYMTSQSANDGSTTIQITFNLERDQDMAAVDVQNRYSSVVGSLPMEVQKTGITLSKKSTAIVGAFALFTDHGEYDSTFISNYAQIYLVDAIKRVPGVGDVVISGQRTYSMRLWLDPDKLAARGLTATDVINTVQEQNVLVPGGVIGKPPISSNQMIQMNVLLKSRLSEPEEFDNLVLKTGSDGSLIKIKDIGYSELGAQDYSTLLRFKRKDSVGLIVYQLPEANEMAVFNGVVEKMNELQKDFPPGLKYVLAFETESVVKESIKEVIETLFEAIILVVLVIFFFLQSFRSTLIPVITIPVSLIGTFAFMKIFGFSINTLSLFGLVLATGLVVDDAIVVIENIQRIITDKNLPARQAASEGMRTVVGAVVASTLVLAAVFLPVAALPGTTGQLYKQFALTIVFSVCISLFNALTLTPALSGLLLVKEDEEHKHKIFVIAENLINGTRDKYHSLLKFILNNRAFSGGMIIIYFVLLFSTYILFKTVPPGFLPNEDQGYFITSVQAPSGASLNYTVNVIKKVEDIYLKHPLIRWTYAIAGSGINGNGSNFATVYATLLPIEERKTNDRSANVVIADVSKEIAKISDAIVIAMPPPPIRGIGTVGGFQFEILDKGGHTTQDLDNQLQQFLAAGRKSNIVDKLYSTYSANYPRIFVDINRDQAKRLGISLSTIFDTFQVYLASYYVNQFNYINRVFQLYVQATQSYRDNPKNIDKFYVNTSSGSMVPLSNLVKMRNDYGPQIIYHYNLFRNAEITGGPSEGHSSGQAIQEMEKLADENLGEGMGYEWSGIALEQIKAGIQAVVMFTLGLLFVYLILAAQYESLIDPLIIILVVPLAICGALLAQLIRGLENDVYCQIGLVMLIGLACKNSILIVEFANQLIESGKDRLEAVLEATKTRFRPIIMTTIAFVLGIMPLVIATGPGSMSRNSMGTAVLGGMVLSTLLSLFIVPVLFLVIKYFEEKISKVATKKKKA